MGAVFLLLVVAYNLIRITKMLRAQEVMADCGHQGAKGTENQDPERVFRPLKASDQNLDGGQPD